MPNRGMSNVQAHVTPTWTLDISCWTLGVPDRDAGCAGFCTFAHQFSLLATLNMNAQLSVSELIDNAARLEIRDFDKFFHEMLSLRARRVAPVLSPQETELLEQIYQKLPHQVLARYAELTEKRRLGSIADVEYEELLRLIPTTEDHNVRRLKSLARLAEIRQTTVRELMTQLGISPLYHA
jgi:hypothetical protein